MQSRTDLKKPSALSLKVEVAYATFVEQVIIPLQVPEGTTIGEAIVLSKILSRFPEIDLTTSKVGIFSQVCKLETPLKSGDRVEIYRPLLCDPMQARRQRAMKAT